MAHRPPTPPTRRRRRRAHGANSHAPRLQPPSSTPLRSGGLPLWATALSPEPGPRGRTQPRPATPAPKPRLTSPPAFEQNIGTRKMTRERNISCTQPSRQPNTGGATDAQTPTPPVACDRNAQTALLNLGSNNLTWLVNSRLPSEPKVPGNCASMPPSPLLQLPAQPLLLPPNISALPAWAPPWF